MIICASLAVTVLPQQLRAEPQPSNLARLDAIYIGDPAAPWFEEWADTNLKFAPWHRRPDIQIKAGSELLAAVAANPAGIGLLTRGELSKLQAAAAAAPQVRSTATGISVCAALSVSEARREENFGDFALAGETTEVLATSDTLAIAEALIDVHRLKDRMTLKQTDADLAFAELASGKSAIAVMPVLPQSRLRVPPNAAGFHAVGISELATDALRSRGLGLRDYRTSFIQQLPLIGGIRTACDEIMLVTAAATSLAPALVKAPPAPWTNPFAGSDLESRVRQALDGLRSLWTKSTEVRG